MVSVSPTLRLPFISIITLSVFPFSITTAQEDIITGSPYQPNIRDFRILNQAENALQPLITDGNKERIISMIARVDLWLATLKDPKSQYVLFALKQALLDGFARAVSIAARSESTSWNTLWEEETETPSKENMTTTPLISLDTPHTIPERRKQFYEKYHTQLQNPEPVLEQCLTHYDTIDAVAQEYNFPTPLIIATRYKEHTCHFSNPWNGWGNFQITSAYHEPGEISLEEFEQQIKEFIAFSRNKRAWYDRLQKFDTIPVTLAYNDIDLLSLQKHAILYNGLYEWVTPENSRYANAYFGTGGNGRDGIVAYTIKIIGALTEKTQRTAP